MNRKELQEKMALYRVLEMETEFLEEEVKRWASKGQIISAAYSHVFVKGGEGTNRLEKSVEEIADLQEAILESINEMAAARREIEAYIRLAEDPVLIHLLRLRYIKGCGWEKIAEKMQYDSSWVYRLHTRALNRIIAAVAKKDDKD